MTVPIISDSHGCGVKIYNVLAKLKAIKEDAREMIFLGDGAKNFIMTLPDDIKLYAVLGNCDGDVDIFDGSGEIVPLERVEEMGGVRILMMHGHRYFVKHSLNEAIFRAAALNADILLFGHTHNAFYKTIPEGTEVSGMPLKKPLHVFNPGAFADGSFGLLTVRNGEVLLSHGKA